MMSPAPRRAKVFNDQTNNATASQASSGEPRTQAAYATGVGISMVKMLKISLISISFQCPGLVL